MDDQSKLLKEAAGAGQHAWIYIMAVGFMMILSKFFGWVFKTLSKLIFGKEEKLTQEMKDDIKKIHDQINLILNAQATLTMAVQELRKELEAKE